MPLHRRLPKRGFTNIFKKEWIEVSLAALERSFNAGEEVTPEGLHDRGLIKKAKRDVVVLGNGEISRLCMFLPIGLRKARGRRSNARAVLPKR